MDHSKPAAPRACARCGRSLSRYNDGDKCGGCAKAGAGNALGARPGERAPGLAVKRPEVNAPPVAGIRPGEPAVAVPIADGKTTLPQEKRNLREQMRADGKSDREICAEFARAYRLRPRTAWRESRGWSLTEAARLINMYRSAQGMDPTGSASMTGAHLCEYEKWPGFVGNSPPGRKPSLQLLVVMAGAYGCEVIDLIDAEDRARLSPADLMILDGMPSAPQIQLVQFTPDDFTPDEERLIYAARSPRRHDPAVTDALSALLAGQRKTEDSIGAAPLIGPVMAQLVVVTDLVTEARGDLRAKVLDIGSQWAQFAGWLHASGGKVAEASRLYGLALEWATEAGNADMVATALNMRGHAAWIDGKVGPMLGLSRAAQRVAGISPGVRALAVQQEARGTALAGEATTADIDRKFDEAERLIAQAVAQPDREPPWNYFFSPHYLAMQHGLAFRLAGEPAKAAVLLERGLAALPAELRQSDWIARYLIDLGLCYAKTGDVAAACKLGHEVIQIGLQTRSERLNRDVLALHSRLCRRWPDDPRVVDLSHALH